MKHFDSTHQMMLTREMNRTIKLGNLQIPAETQLYLPMTAIHHDTDIWGADAKEFNPICPCSKAVDDHATSIWGTNTFY